MANDNLNKFYVSPVVNEKNISRENWFKDEKKIKLIMGEVVKIGKYFESEILGIAKEVQKKF